jgi:hypothetical protein
VASGSTAAAEPTSASAKPTTRRSHSPEVAPAYLNLKENPSAHEPESIFPSVTSAAEDSLGSILVRRASLRPSTRATKPDPSKHNPAKTQSL